MNEESQIKALFDESLAAIAGKDADKLRGMADESLAVRHVMTGNVQSGLILYPMPPLKSSRSFLSAGRVPTLVLSVIPRS